MKTTLFSLVLLDIALVALSLLRFPAAGLIHATPISVMLMLYGIAILVSWGRLEPQAKHWAMRLGLAAGVVLSGEVLLEYLTLPKDNTLYGVFEYGLFLFLMAAAGWLAYQNGAGPFGSVQAGVWTGVIGSLIWYGVILVTLHLFFGTAQQAQVFQAEGDLQDFVNSGMTDFDIWMVQDFFGAGFFTCC